MPSPFEKLYLFSPIWLQNLGISLYGLKWRRRRFGGIFEQELRQYKFRESYSAEAWEKYQTQQLQKILRQAVSGVPYYRKAFGGLLKNTDDFLLKDLPSLPLLEKQMIRKNPEDFMDALVSRRGLEGYPTSGTTGTPLEIKFTAEMHQKWSAAYEARCRLWAGVNRNMSRAMIGGRLVVPKANAKPPFWRYNFFERQLYLSAFHISPENVPYYVQALNHYRPDYLVGYASSHFFLAKMIEGQGLKVHAPKAILTSSEKLTDEMRALLQRVYHSPVFDAYSGVEACCLASECDYHRLHVSSDVGIVELINEQGRPAAAGEMGEIVATGLLNEVQPLIRYRTGDYAVGSEENCPCGRKMPVLKELIGRLEDTVTGPDGRETVRFHGIFLGISKIREGQVIQETLSNYRLKLAVDEALTEADKRIITKRFEERLGNITLTFEYVDQIERTEGGKFRAVVSKLASAKASEKNQR